MTINGETGPDYIIQVSTNLVSPTVPFLFTDTNAAALPAQFYRVLLGP